jgi:hypothetical protein
VVTSHPPFAEPASIARKEAVMTVMEMEKTRELAYRSSAGIDVTLLWNADTDELTVTAFDSSTSELLELSAEREDALDVFNHPFAYAAHGLVSCSS